MQKKISMKTLQNILVEVDHASRDKSRTIDSILDKDVQRIVKIGCQVARSSGFAVWVATAVGAATAVGTGTIL